MAGLNEVKLIGNLGVNPEVRYTKEGTAVCTFRLATNEKWKGKDGQVQEHVEWHNVVVWGKQGEVVAQHLSKGSQVYVAGRLRTEEWEKEGVKRYTTKIVATDVLFLGSKRVGAPAGEDPGRPVRGGDAADGVVGADDHGDVGGEPSFP